MSVDTGAITQALRFPGQWFQAETGLHQNWMRDYDLTTGRYLQADPFGLVDGPSVYGYARQSPGRWVDPRGMDTLTLGSEIEIITGLGAGGSIGFLGNYHCDVLTVGTFETVKGGVGLDVSPSVYPQYTGVAFQILLAIHLLLKLTLARSLEKQGEPSLENESWVLNLAFKF